MRIAHIISVMAEADGHSLYCRRLCEELAGVGHACSVCCGEDPELQPMALPATVPVRRLPVHSRLAQAGSMRLRREVDNFLAGARPDLVHIHGLWHPLVHVGVACARRRGVPILTSLHGMARPCALRIGRWKKWMAWQVYQRHDLRSAAVLHAMTSQEADDPLCNRLGVPICIAPMGVDLAENPPRRASGGDRRVVYLGRMHPGKGLSDLLDAWAAVRPSGWKLVLAGPDERGHVAELRRKAEARGMARDVIWRGSVYGSDKERLFAEADLLVLPSRSESFGAVVGEALARGVPVITTKGTPWAVLEGAGDSEQLSVSSEQLAVNSEQLAGDSEQLAGDSEQLAVSSEQSATCHPQLPTAHCPLPTGHRSLLTDNCSLATGRRSLPTAHCSLATGHRSLLTDNCSLLTGHSPSRCGWWVDSGVEPLARALQEATGLSDGQRAEMGARGRELVRQRYAWSAVGAQMATVYEQAL
jgi:glycosyltransferase involved in cell wall biosynthesis